MYIFILFTLFFSIQGVTIEKSTEWNQNLREIIQLKRDHLFANSQNPLHWVNTTTKFGTLTGFNDGNTTHYLGVPFATPPVGNYRWKSPIDPSPWGHVNATWVSNSLLSIRVQVK